MEFRLPYPPSVNHYWRQVGGRTLVSRAGRAYRNAVVAAGVPALGLLGKIEVSILARPPDNRRRDLDNILKAAIDGMQRAGVYLDDSQIAKLVVERGEVTPGGELIVQITR